VDRYRQSNFFDQLPVWDAAAKPMDHVRGDSRFVIAKSGFYKQCDQSPVVH
jgi:hypothetical protein